MVRKRGIPEIGELVVIRITKINPNSAFAVLEEYGKEGMIHISEVSSGWVRDIRGFLREGQNFVAKVMRTDDKIVALSLKRVDKKQENDKMKEYKLNQRAEKMLEFAAKSLNKSFDEAYEEAGFTMLEKFPSMYDAFRTSLQNPDVLKRRGIPDKWLKAIIEVAGKNIEQKEFEFRVQLFLKTYKPGGVSIITGALKKMEKSGLEVRYIAAPNYLVKYKSTNAKLGEREIIDKIKASLSGIQGLEADYALKE